MLQYIVRRTLMLIPTLIAITIISFVLIQLPPGDYLTSYIARLESTGTTLDESQIAALKKRYGLGQPIYVQFFKWIWGVVQGDFGMSARMLQAMIFSFITFTFVFVTLLMHRMRLERLSDRVNAIKARMMA